MHPQNDWGGKDTQRKLFGEAAKKATGGQGAPPQKGSKQGLEKAEWFVLQWMGKPQRLGIWACLHRESVRKERMKLPDP